MQEAARVVPGGNTNYVNSPTTRALTTQFDAMAIDETDDGSDLEPLDVMVQNRSEGARLPVDAIGAQLEDLTRRIDAREHVPDEEMIPVLRAVRAEELRARQPTKKLWIINKYGVSYCCPLCDATN